MLSSVGKPGTYKYREGTNCRAWLGVTDLPRIQDSIQPNGIVVLAGHPYEMQAVNGIVLGIRMKLRSSLILVYLS